LFGNRHLAREAPQRIPGVIEHLIAIGPEARKGLVDACDRLHVARNVEVGEDLMDEFLWGGTLAVDNVATQGKGTYLEPPLGEPF
jgi:hypothetical protein